MLIGLSGKKGSGKDTAYHFIQEWADDNGQEVRRDAFADRLKLSAARIFFPDIDLKGALDWANRIKGDDCYGDPLGFIILEEEGTVTAEISGRTLLQRYGTECHRDVFNDGFWLDPVALAYQDLPDSTITVVTDVRFDNEAELIHEFEGEVWEIQRGLDDEDVHASEKPLSRELVDAVIPNHGDIEDFKDEILLQLKVFV